MNVIAFIDLAASITVFFGLVYFLVGLVKNRPFSQIGVLFVALMSVTLLFYVSLSIEWLWQLKLFAEVEDFISVVLPMFWAMFFYGLYQHVLLSDLDKSERLHREFIENQPLGFFRIETGGTGKIIFANKAMANMFGYESVEDFLQIPAEELYQSSKDRQRFLSILYNASEVNKVELQGRKRDGTIFDVSLTVHIIRDEAGRPSELEGSVEDISVRKEIEKALSPQ